MIDNRKVLAVVPARGGSKGLPDKNLRILYGKPLVCWPISAAIENSFVDRTIVSTDDKKIAEVAASSGADVPFLRPTNIAGDKTSSMDVVLHALDELESKGDVFSYVIMLEPTSPMTVSDDIDKALLQLHSTRSIADSIVGVSLVEAAHPEYNTKLDKHGRIKPYKAKDFLSLPRRQELEDIYFLEGSLYISSVSDFRKNKSFYHDRTLGYVVPRWKSIEIDDYLDLIIAEAVMSNKKSIIENIVTLNYN
jgi:CMP-N,N'-diacetyllegionaminic acid synthase